MPQPQLDVRRLAHIVLDRIIDAADEFLTALMPPMYPTPEEIMGERLRFKLGVIPTTRAWKEDYFRGWRNLSDEEKFNKIRVLLNAIDAIYNPEQDNRLQAIICSSEAFDRYVPSTRTIFLHKPSIVTALHELGHHLFGESELLACRFSAQLFQRVFPNQFANLRWSGHALVRRTEDEQSSNPNTESPSIEEQPQDER